MPRPTNTELHTMGMILREIAWEIEAAHPIHANSLHNIAKKLIAAT